MNLSLAPTRYGPGVCGQALMGDVILLVLNRATHIAIYILPFFLYSYNGAQAACIEDECLAFIDESLERLI